VERPARAKKNYRPAQVVFDHTIQRRTSEQVKADEAKARTEAAAAEATAIAHMKSQFDRCAAVEDAMQADDNAKSLEALRPDLHIDPESAPNTDVDTLLGPPVVDCSSYRGSSHSEEFLTGWEEVEDRAVVVEENYEDEDEHEDEDEDYTVLSKSETEASEASEDQSQTRKPGPAVKARGKRRRNEQGKFRASVINARQVPPPPLPHSKKRKAAEPPPPAEGHTSTKCTKASEPGGLLPNWKKDVGILEHIARKNPIEFVDEEDDLVVGEFDKPEGLEMLNAVRASKPSAVRIETKSVCDHLIGVGVISDRTYMQADVKVRPVVIYHRKPKQNKVVVDDLPFPHPRMLYNAKWQKAFRPTLLSWASTWPDPYATNTHLDEDVVLEIWDIIYPDIELSKQDRIDTGVKLVYLVRVLYTFVMIKSYRIFPGWKYPS
jgi:hypothetical protein